MRPTATRFHVKYNGSNIFIGFYPKNFRFVFYTHGVMNGIRDWKDFIADKKLTIYDEDNNALDWTDFMKFVDHCQYFSNAKWVNGWTLTKDGYNFSNNKKGSNVNL